MRWIERNIHDAWQFVHSLPLHHSFRSAANHRACSPDPRRTHQSALHSPELTEHLSLTFWCTHKLVLKNPPAHPLLVYSLCFDLPVQQMYICGYPGSCIPPPHHISGFSILYLCQDNAHCSPFVSTVIRKKP